MDFDWRFAFGHPYDTKKDFNTGTGYFSYLAKASYGDGAAAQNFDDRSWRKINVPHDWAVELPLIIKEVPVMAIKQSEEISQIQVLAGKSDHTKSK